VIYSRKAEISAWKFEKKTLKIVLSGSSGPGNPMLWELRGERVKLHYQSDLELFSKFCSTCITDNTVICVGFYASECFCKLKGKWTCRITLLCG